MIPKLESAEYVADYRIRLRFVEGLEGEIGLAAELWGGGGVLSGLRTPPSFRRFGLGTELNTIGWTGADLEPVHLYE